MCPTLSQKYDLLQRTGAPHLRRSRGKIRSSSWGCISLELRGQPGRLRDLPCNDEDMHVVGHGFHASDTDAERLAFGPDEPLEFCFNFSIYQFLPVLRAPYQVIADIVHAMR